MDGVGRPRWTGMGDHRGLIWPSILGERGCPSWTGVAAHCGRKWTTTWAEVDGGRGRIWTARWTYLAVHNGRGWTWDVVGQVDLSGRPNWTGMDVHIAGWKDGHLNARWLATRSGSWLPT